MDRFFVSYNFEEDMFLHSVVNLPIRQLNSRRVSLMKYDVSYETVLT